MMKLKKDITKKRALHRWFTEEFINKNPLIYKKIYSMLENTNHETWLNVYKLFAHYEDDDVKIKQITAKTLIITGENDVGSKPRMSEESGLVPLAFDRKRLVCKMKPVIVGRWPGKSIYLETTS